MVFSSLSFLCIFLPVIFLLHFVIPGIRIKNALLLLASLVFYAYGEPVYIWLLLLSAFANYCFGMWIGARKNKIVLSLAVIVNLGLLLVFKYAGFLVDCANKIAGTKFPIPGISLPIGISFFTFQAMSYVIDVYREEAKVQKNFAKVLLYISLFPQLIAGPIVRYQDIEDELEHREMKLEQMATGMRRFLAGLGKKVLIANTMGLVVDTLFAANASEVNILVAWIGAISYLFQIYFDFSGYSDMAIGMGLMFGFHFRENFQYPYVAGNVQEFWRRWHISLTSWFREYLYIPLGGNRKGKARTMLNRFLVFLCTGIWHGANLTFLFWGIYHGFFLTMETLLFGKNRKNGSVKKSGIPGHIYTLLVVCVGFVFFRADTIGQGFFWVKEMFAGFHFEREAVSLAIQQLTPLYLVVSGAAVIGSMPVREKVKDWKYYEPCSYLASLFLLVICILSLAGNTYNPFIYFQF